MTIPHGDLETLLRRELTTAVSRVEPGADALERIRARTRRRPPQPWLLSVVSGAVSRARYWVWRGHWAWPASPPVPRPQARHRHRSAAWPGGKRATVTNWVTGTNWLRPAGALAAIAFLAIVTVAVPPLRQAIGHVTAKVLTVGQSSGGGGTEGNGSPAGKRRRVVDDRRRWYGGCQHERYRNRIPPFIGRVEVPPGHDRSDGHGAGHAELQYRGGRFVGTARYPGRLHGGLRNA